MTLTLREPSPCWQQHACAPQCSPCRYRRRRPASLRCALHDDLVSVSTDVANHEVWLITHPEVRRDPRSARRLTSSSELRVDLTDFAKASVLGGLPRGASAGVPFPSSAIPA
jgi:hypothetical protein